MKNFATIIFILFCLVDTSLFSQNKISGYTYWFDNDQASYVTTTITSTENFELSTSVSAAGLNTGLHVFNIQFWDDNSVYSSIVSHFFYKIPEQVVSTKELIAYEYWIDDDYANAVTEEISPVEQFNYVDNIDVSGLNTGLHVFNARFKDNTNMWSLTMSQFFYKIPEQTVSIKELIAYEYWIDDDYTNAIKQTISPVQQFSLADNINVSTLNTGLHVFNIRFKDNTNIWSLTQSQFFYKIPEQTVPTKELIAYEYWIDDDYANAVTQTISPVQLFSLSDNLDLNALNTGLHVVNFRFMDNTHIWSSPLSQFIFKKINTNNLVNNMTEYRYWFDDDFASAVEDQFDPSAPIVMLADNINMTQIWKGQHLLNFQFKDAFGQWSIVTSDTVVKQSLPIADFDFSAQPYCDSTVITTTNSSIDGDVYLWDFGDGVTSDEMEPIHVYVVPGDYPISLTVTDTILSKDSTLIKSIIVIPTTSVSTIEPVSCDSYTSPSGNYTWTTSGSYLDTLTNSIGCDSIITVNLTILNSTFNTIQETACNSYASPSGNYTWTTSGTYLDTLAQFSWM